MRPPPPRPAANAIASVPPAAPRVPPRIEMKSGSPEAPADVRLDLVPSERPTPRSTVIPRLPGPVLLSGMRPQLETLIFHGAPPVLPASPPRPALHAPSPPRSEAFQDVLSEELLSDAEIDDAEPSTQRAEPEESGIARTERPPPFLGSSRGRELRVIAAITVALAAPITLAAFMLDRAPRATNAPQAGTTAPTAAARAPARAAGTCAVDGAPKVLARRALVRGGVEATTLDDRLGFASLSSPKSGTAFELDARTLAVRGSARVVSSSAVLHVVPELDSEAPIDAQVDTTALRTIPDAEGESAFGLRDGFAVWGPRDGDGMVRLWKLAGTQVLEAPRVAPLGTSGERLVVFRRSNAIWIGSFRGGQTTSELVRLSTSPYAGAPAIDAHGDEAVVAWAERGTTGPWGIRWARWSASGAASEARTLDLPPGGPGDRAMAPSVAALGDGRFLLAWTEAGHGKNQVRAQVIDAADRASGEPIAVSSPDAVAGQETIALTDSGHGAIAYLVARRGSFELRASAIDCAR